MIGLPITAVLFSFWLLEFIESFNPPTHPFFSTGMIGGFMTGVVALPFGVLAGIRIFRGQAYDDLIKIYLGIFGVILLAFFILITLYA